MIVGNRSFPHPVLSPLSDDVTPSAFDLTLDIGSDAEYFYLKPAFEYANPTIEALIRDGRAVHSVHVECKRNYYRQLHQMKPRRGAIAIESSEIVGRVEVSGFVNALAGIPDYRIDGSHPDYGEAVFSVEPGDVLAVAPLVVFDAYVDYDPLTSISSILTLQRSKDVVDGPLQLDSSGDTLVATLAQSDFDNYRDLKGDPTIAPLLANQVVVPVLVEAVNELKSDQEMEFEEDMLKRWFRSIARKLETEHMDVRSGRTPVLEAVQALLRLPLRRSLRGLLDLTDEEPDA